MLLKIYPVMKLTGNVLYAKLAKKRDNNELFIVIVMVTADYFNFLDPER